MSTPWGAGPPPPPGGPWPGPSGHGSPAGPPYAGPPYAGFPPAGFPPAGSYPAPRPVVPPGAPPHDVAQPYPSLMRSRRWSWWRPLVGLLLFAVLYTLATVVLVVLAAVTGLAPDLELADLTDPMVLLVTNLSLIVAIPIVWLCWVAAHQMGIGWSSSVLGRLRWRLFLPLTWRALATLGVWIAVQVLLEVLTGDDVAGPSSDFVWLALIVVFTTPLQSAAEEYVFRGYLTQAIAGWIRAPRAGAVVAALVTAALFSLAHLPSDLGLFLDRFAFGLAASAVVWLTGGLEASIVLHAVNNVLVFLLAGVLGQTVDDEATGGVGLLVVLLDVVAMGAYVAVVAVSRRRLRPEQVSPALDLRAAAVPGPPPGWGPPGAVAPYRAPYDGPPYGGPSYGGPSYVGPGPLGPPGWYPPHPAGPAWGPAPWAPPGPFPGHAPGQQAPAPPPDQRWARPDDGRPPG